MKAKSVRKSPEAYCPILEKPCPRGTEAAASCRERYEYDFNPLQNWRDMAILCCAGERISPPAAS